MAKKKIIERKRFDALSMEIDETHINPDTGVMEIDLHFDQINNEQKAYLSHSKQLLESTKQVRGYFGENKMRTLWEIPKDKGDHSLDLLKKIKRFDILLAMDTNTRLINRETYSIGIAGHVIGEITEAFETWDFKGIQQLFVLVGKGERIENRNWKNLIEYVLQHPKYNADHKIGIIVDSDLGEIDNYNKKIKPLIDDFFLPENFELLYASDKAHDNNPINAAIKHCHNVADTALNLLQTEIEKYDI
jgi:hypothetical protein